MDCDITRQRRSCLPSRRRHMINKGGKRSYRRPVWSLTYFSAQCSLYLIWGGILLRLKELNC